MQLSFQTTRAPFLTCASARFFLSIPRILEILLKSTENADAAILDVSRTTRMTLFLDYVS